MTSWIGRWSSKGMVTVPDLNNLTRLQAEATLIANGLNPNFLESEDTFNSNLGGKVSFQNIATGTLVDYETIISFKTYQYVDPPTFSAFSFTPTFGAFGFTPTFGAFGFTPTFGAFSFTPTFGAFSFTPTFGAFAFTPAPCGDCVDYGDTVILPTCNGEDTYEGIFQPRRRLCNGVYEECQAAFLGYGNVIEYNTVGCGGSGTFGFTPTFGAFGFTPTFGAFSFTPTFGAFSFTPTFGAFSFTPTFGAFSFTPTFGAFSFTPSNGCPAPGAWGPWSACVNGTRTRTRTNYDDVPGCPPFIEEQSEACTPTFGAFSFTPTFGAFSFTPTFGAFSFTPTFGAFSFTPTFGAFGFTPTFGAFGFTPTFGAFGFTPGFAFFNSIAVTTQVLIAGAPGSSKPAGELKVGDKLLALNIPNPANQDWREWSSENLTFTENDLVETEITSIQIVSEDQFIYIDGDLFSKSHYVLVEKNNIAQFIKATEIDTSYKIFSPDTKTFVEIGLIEMIYMNLNKVSINCEPYDNFFTTKMLVFDMPDPIV